MRRTMTPVLALLFRMLGATWRVQVDGAEHLHGLRELRRPFVFALWHRTLLPLLWWHRNEGVTLLISEHDDGGYLADVALRWGYRTVRGSSTRGGVKGLRGLLRTLERHGTVAITPDGPRGPAGAVKPGAVAAARRTGAPLLPVSANARPAVRVPSWDGMLVPLPFARVRVAYAAPVHVAPDTPDPVASGELTNRLDAATAMATWAT